MLGNLTITEVLAALIGLYFVATSIGLLIARNEFPDLLKELSTQPKIGYLGCVIALVIGGTIIAIHNQWNSYLTGFISLVGWISLVEGVLMLACRRQYIGFFARLSQSANVVVVYGVSTLIAGVILLAAAFVG